MILKRKIYDELTKWKESNNGKSALLIEGARRVGKSTVVQEFAKRNYKDYIILNFTAVSPDIKNLFIDHLYNLDEFFSLLFVYTGKVLEKRNGLIIFDEVQLFPLARQAIKLLVEDGRFDYIETGSLISIYNEKGILLPSEEESINMYPLDFEEFCWAMSETQLIPLLKSYFLKQQTLPEGLHKRASFIFNQYIAIGGMPQAVVTFLEKHNYQSVDEIKKRIVKLYSHHLIKTIIDGDEGKSKVDGRDSLAQRIYSKLPSYLSRNKGVLPIYNFVKQKNKSFFLSLNNFEESKIVNFCYDSLDPSISLPLETNDFKFKVYSGDTGLLVTQILDLNKKDNEMIYKKLLTNNLDINKGCIAENAVSQMLVANGYKLFFNTFYLSQDQEKKHLFEVDFILPDDNKIIPIEVKSGNYKSTESFDYFCDKFSSRVSEKRYIIHNKNLVKKGRTLCIPLYMTIFL